MSAGRGSYTEEYKAEKERREGELKPDPWGEPEGPPLPRPRSKYTWRDLAAANLRRFAQIPPPHHRVMVVVELDDVLRAATAAFVKGLKLGEEGIDDIASLYLFHCKGFGTPSGGRLNSRAADVSLIAENEAKLQQMPYTPVDEVQNFRYGLHSLHMLGHEVYLCSANDDKAWLRSKDVYHGPTEMFSLLLPKHADLSKEKQEQIIVEHHAKYPTPVIDRPTDVPMSAADIALVEQMRKETHEADVVYLTTLADMIKQKYPERVVYISSTRDGLNIMGRLLKDRGIHDHDLVLFGDYPWNKVEVDWGQPGAWMKFEQRQESGVALGKVVDTGDNGLKAVRSWIEVVELFDPEHKDFMFDAEQHTAVEGPVKSDREDDGRDAHKGEAPTVADQPPVAEGEASQEK